MPESTGARALANRHRAILEILSRECPPGDELTAGVLEHAVALWASAPGAAIRALRQLHVRDPRGFTLEAVRLLISNAGGAPGLRCVADLVFNGNLLIDLLLDERALPLDAALRITSRLADVEPLLDARLVHRLIERTDAVVAAIERGAALRTLALLDAVPDCSHVAAHLVQFTRHPCPRVRSKAALHLGRANLNLDRVRSLMDATDPRVSANAVESLSGHHGPGVRTALWEAARSPHGRTATNALLELCRRGDRDAAGRLVAQAESTDPTLRAGAAWAMGQTRDPQFADVLKALERDDDPRVRAMAGKSAKKLGGQAPRPPE
jgi:HEAT repeat protein